MAGDSGAAADRTTILVVEDNESVRELIVKALAPTGARILVAGSAAEAVAAAAGTQIDLLLTDVGLPGASGTELATTLRSEQSAMRVIFMTGWQEHPALGDITGGVLLSKPFNLAELARVVAGALGQDPVNPAT
jgi:CheY-like chemotaxis protein